MIILKFILNLIYNLIKENVGKVILLTIIAISFHYAGSFEEYPVKIKIDKIIQIDSGYLYLYKRIENNEVVYKNFFHKTPQVLEDSNITIMEYNGYNIPFWIILVVVSIILFVVLMDEGWGYREIYTDTFSCIIDCEIENGKFVYLAMGRLVGISDWQLSRTGICREFDVYGFKDLKSRPKFKTKSQQRESLLNELGV